MRLKRKSPDFILFMSVIMLLSVGIVMVFSASQNVTIIRYEDSFYYFKRQLIWAVLGVAAMVATMNIDYYKIKRWVGPLLILAISLLVLVLIPGIGKEVNGSWRWINLGFISFAPAELVKLCMIAFIAFGLSKRTTNLQSFTSGLCPYLAIMGLAAGLILLQPDLGTAIVLCGTIMIMFLAAGAKMNHLFGLGAVGLGLVGLAIYIKPYRMKRFLAFMDPAADPQGAG